MSGGRVEIAADDCVVLAQQKGKDGVVSGIELSTLTKLAVLSCRTNGNHGLSQCGTPAGKTEQ